MLAAFDHAGRPRGPFEEHLDEIAEAVRRDLEVAANAEDAVCGLSALMPGISAMTVTEEAGIVDRFRPPQCSARRAWRGHKFLRDVPCFAKDRWRIT